MNTIETKQQAFELFETNRPGFLSNCREIAVRIAKEHMGCVNIDQVREQVALPQGLSPSVFGAVFHTLEFEHSGYTITQRKTSHGREIKVWKWLGYDNWKRNQRKVEYQSLSLF